MTLLVFATGFVAGLAFAAWELRKYDIVRRSRRVPAGAQRSGKPAMSPPGREGWTGLT